MLAHRSNDGREETLTEHLRRVAHQTETRASAFGMAPEGRRTGLWHDLGKACRQFQDYLRGRAPHGGHHSTAGALHAARNDALAEAISIACHHTGLHDFASVQKRLQNPDYPDLVEEALGHLDDLLDEAHTPAPESNGEPRDPETLALKIRLLHSALIDSDWLETERWRRGGSFWRPDHPPLAELRDRFLADQERLAAETAATEINRIRADIREACCRAANGPVGLYTAEIPTGGGKTRSLMEFALRHAEVHGHDQVIVVVPFISIIEQNAQVYRDAFGVEEGTGAVLEHHSLRELSDAERLTSETWDAPVVITTMVQAFESLFGRTNRQLRKIHRLANSVLIVDEIQALPVEVTAPTLRALQDLADVAGTTTVMSSATQLPIDGATPIIDDAASLYQSMKRVEYQFDESQYTPDALWNEYGEDQMLVVCNTVADARRLTEASPETCYHLSTAMAPAHRTRTLEAVREHLKQGEPVRLVSTQVIEAGVDISFPFVVRIEGPLDGIIQAAGRCNREGEADGLGEVVVTRLKEGGMPPAPYCTAAGIVRHWIESEEEIDPNDPDWCRRFYEALYRQHDRDKYNVGLHLRDLDLKTAADQYRIIDDETTPYVVEAEVPERLLEQARTGDLDRGVIRALQPYLVTLYPWQADEAKQSSFSEPIDPRGEGDLMLWTGPYDDAGIRWE